MTELFPDIPTQLERIGALDINFRMVGQGPPILLLHGYPQSHVIWHGVVKSLSPRYTLVMPDMRGYGDSSKPPSDPEHANYSKKSMASDMVSLMTNLGFDQFFLCGHDRGGRVAHRLCLDYPPRVKRLMLLDVAPTRVMLERTDQHFARAYFHWFFLAQASPVPETMIGSNPDFFLECMLGGFRSKGLSVFNRAALRAYKDAFRNPETIRAGCEDYRAALTIDMQHDIADAGKKIECPVHLLWSEHGVIGKMFSPLREWQDLSEAVVTGHAVNAGHFIPDEIPQDLSFEICKFFV
jgi:haloacetate dehalogenase